MGEDDELAARMRAADPAAGLPPVDPDRLRSLMEETMSTERPAASRDRTPRWLPALAVAALVLVGAGILLGVRGTGDPAPPRAGEPTTSRSAEGTGTVTELTTPESFDARCLAPSAEVLGRADLAVDARVTGIEDRQVTLSVQHWYAGEETDTVVVTAPSEALADLVQSVHFVDGRRYLVAANDGAVMICGFSGPHTQDLEQLYRTAFAGR